MKVVESSVPSRKIDRIHDFDDKITGRCFYGSHLEPDFNYGTISPGVGKLTNLIASALSSVLRISPSSSTAKVKTFGLNTNQFPRGLSAGSSPVGV